MHLSPTDDSNNNDIEYQVNIQNWPWNDNGNHIEFCFDINSMDDINDNMIHLDTPNKVITDIINNNTLNICHIVYSHYVNITHFVIVTFINDTDNIWFNSTIIIIDINDNDKYNNNLDSHLPWLFGVFIAIGFVVCIFACLIIYLMKEGFFDDDQSQFIKNKKRKKPTMIIMDNNNHNNKNNNYNYSKNRSNTSSPTKNLRINVTLCNDNNNNNNNNDNKELSVTKTKSFTKSITKRKSITCESTKIIHETSALICIQEDIEAEEEDDFDDNNHMTLSMGTPTITNSINNDESESEFEDSMVQYVLSYK